MCESLFRGSNPWECERMTQSPHRDDSFKTCSFSCSVAPSFFRFSACDCVAQPSWRAFRGHAICWASTTKPARRSARLGQDESQLLAKWTVEMNTLIFSSRKWDLVNEERNMQIAIDPDLLHKNLSDSLTRLLVVWP